MHKNYLFLFLALSLLSCKDHSEKKETPIQQKTTLNYAKGLTIEDFETYKIVTITNPWPDAEQEYRYALAEKGIVVPQTKDIDAVLEIPLKTVVVTSTTHIPSLEMLGVTNTLVGFPNLDYISSQQTRKRVDQGLVQELGKNEDINTEVLIDLHPDAVVTFAVEGGNKALATMSKTGIPVLFNADWTETHPLGKAEWIKFFGVLYGKEKEADRIFSEIETAYKNTKLLAEQAVEKPTVLSGAMYKDIWYLPQGDSWAAQFIADANGKYLWSESEGTGSISLNLESVLEKGKDADFWIGPGQFSSLTQLKEAHSVYAEFNAFQEKKVFSFTSKKGPTGGILYYELAPNRPDIVLKDILKILHPELLPDHQLYFFSLLE